jgi:hypothetical protein
MAQLTAPQQITGYSLILDSRVHRTVLLSDTGNWNDLSLADDYQIYVTNEYDPTTQTMCDFMTIIKSNQPEVKIKCKGTHQPPMAGTNIGAVTDPNFQFPCYVFQELHRVLVLGEDLSADPNYRVVLSTSFTPGDLAYSDVFTVTPTAAGAAPTTISSLDKIPPKIG